MDTMGNRTPMLVETASPGEHPCFVAELRPILLRLADDLTFAISFLEDAQYLLRVPTREEIARMRRGVEPLSQEAHLLGLLQRTIVSIENVASDLHAGLDEATLAEPGAIPPSV